MFNNFISSDEKKREAVMNRRLMMLRCAREKGYFDEAGSEPVPKVVADGIGPDDDRPIVDEALRRLYAPPRMNVYEFSDGDSSAVPKNIITPDAAQKILDAVDRVCPECAGHGAPLNADGNPVGVCETCDGIGAIDDDDTCRQCHKRYDQADNDGSGLCWLCNPHARPKDKPTCSHQNVSLAWWGWKRCLDCRKYIRE